jgi:protein O-GlcNAc transferase
MASVDEALREAVSHHEAGRLAEAERIYRQILASQPAHADALHLLGLAAFQAGRPEAAVDSISRAISVRPDQGAFHHHLGQALLGLGRASEAQDAFARALQLDPTNAAAHYHLGLIEQHAGNWNTAQQHYEQALVLRPGIIEAQVNLGDVFRSQGQLVRAEIAYRAAAHSFPTSVEAQHNLGAVLIDLGRFNDAIEPLQRAAKLRPDLVQVHYNLGRAHKGAGRPHEAVAQFQAALAARPDFVPAHFALANLLQEAGDLEAAGASYRTALELAPNDAEALANYGKVLHRLGRNEEALDYYNRAITLKPDLAIAHFNRAVMFNESNQPDEALELSRAALAIEPNSARLIGNMAVALHLQGRAAEAIEHYRKATELKPHSSAGHSNLLYALNFCRGHDAETIFREHLAWGRMHAEPLTQRAVPHSNDPTPGRRLRIGYVSPYFRHHAVNYFTEPMLLEHDHAQFEIFCYSDVAQADATTLRIKAAADHWRDTLNLSAEEIARQVRDDRIDILVDLTGHIGGGRLLVFARRPAPIQVTYIGYQNTTGMSAMDYRLTDAHADPPGLADRYYTERLVRLPRAFFCYKPFDDSPPVTPLPALAAGHVTFGSFNNLMKVTPEAIEVWLEILSRVPASRLVVLAYRGGHAERNLHARARAHGIEPSRVEVFEKCSTPDFLKWQQRADIALDPFPFNGHTTTCDSIWMGVPVVMLEGDAYVSRFGGSVLANVGLNDLIAHNTDEYIDIAVGLASELPRLERLRDTLRQRMADSPLMDYAGFTRNLESAYRKMWVDWCDRRQTIGS